MDKMQALIFHSPGNISVEELPIPKPGPGEVLVRVRATSICASDIRVYKGEKAARPGVIPGHEIAGEIWELGAGVEEYSKGESVVICPILACGECYFCLLGKRNRCLKRVTLGYDENGGLAHFLLASEALVKLGHIIRVPKDMPFEIAAMTEPFACSLNSLEVCRVQPGGSLVIIGAGPMGLTHLLLARAMGCSQIIMSDPIESRLKFAGELGATMCINPEKQGVREEVMKATRGIGADASILTVGNPKALDDSLGAVRKQGFVNLFAGFPPGSQLLMDANRIHYDEIFLTGTQNATPDHYIRASRLLGVIPDARRLITHRFSAQEADQSYHSRLALEGFKSVVIYD